MQTVTLTEREVELIKFALDTYTIVGTYEQRGKVTEKDYDLANKILDKLL